MTTIRRRPTIRTIHLSLTPRVRLALLALAAAVLWAALFPGWALAQDIASDSPPIPRSELLPSVQVWAALVGAVVPLLTYVINRYVPSEPLRASILVVASAVAGAVVQLLDTGGLAFDVNTLQVILTAVVGALGAHHGFWKPAHVAARLRAEPVRDAPPVRGGV